MRPFAPLQVPERSVEETHTNGAASAGAMSTPFLALYGEGEGPEASNPVAAEYALLLNELHDEEFDEAVFELVGEARSILDGATSDEVGDARAQSHLSERRLVAHFAPLEAEAEAMFASLANQLGSRHPTMLTDEEVETLVNGYQPESGLAPTFEQFFGKLKKAIKKVAKKAVSLAKKGISAVTKLGLGPILNKLKALIKPLLRRVIGTAIGKLPPLLQPHARRLAQQIPFLQEAGEDGTAAHEHPVGSDVAYVQHEFNGRVANILFARDEIELESELADATNARHAEADIVPVAELDSARDRFVAGLANLKEGEDPTPLVQEFIPAILPALKIGISLIGRKRVVDFLAQLLGRLIERFVGPTLTPALSQAIVDAGLGLVALEVRGDDPRPAAHALASTIEETVRHVAAFPDHLLEDQELLEGFVLGSFERAAAANLPAVLPARVYQQRPDLREGRSLAGTWVMMPFQGSRKRYKKFSRKLPIRLSPHKVARLETFEAVPVDQYLEEEVGMRPGEEVEAVVHLYETLPGTHLTDIAASESETPGLGAPDAYRQLHPLTPEAAGLLLGEPDMGREIDPRSLANPHSVAPGQRLFYLEIPGKRVLTVPTIRGRPRARRPTQVRVVFDFPKDEIRVYLFLSEVRSQEIAVRLRQNSHVGAITARLHRIIERGLRSAIVGGSGRLKIVHEKVTPALWSDAMRRLPPRVPESLDASVRAWVLRHVAQHLKQKGDQFIAAAEDTQDGVTALITVRGAPVLSGLRDALQGKVAPSSVMKAGGTPAVVVEATPGYRYE